jgi:hypothetical protein
MADDRRSAAIKPSANSFPSLSETRAVEIGVSPGWWAVNSAGTPVRGSYRHTRPF